MSATSPSLHPQTTKSPTTITRIAVGVDGHPEGNDAVVLGARLARAMHADLMLVAVHPDPLMVLPDEMNRESLARQATDMLQEARSSLASDASLAVEADLSVPRGLERIVRREHRDLLVVGSSRHASRGRVRIGKRTRQLLGEIHCPLAIAPRGLRAGPDRGLRWIGVGYDGTREAEVALGLAGSIAAGAGAKLHVTAVVDGRVPPIGWSALARGGAATPRWEDGVLAEMRSLRERVTSAIAALGVTGHAEVLRGRPTEALLKLSGGVDLLVIGSRRWGPVARVLLGSTGEALAHDAACPLLVVPRPDRA
jgi:nucleotide-binding universal stress UspA family protein